MVCLSSDHARPVTQRSTCLADGWCLGLDDSGGHTVVRANGDGRSCRGPGQGAPLEAARTGLPAAPGRAGHGQDQAVFAGPPGRPVGRASHGSPAGRSGRRCCILVTDPSGLTRTRTSELESDRALTCGNWTAADLTALRGLARPDYGSEGWGFESLRARHNLPSSRR
jgi:hypothetical protein